MTVSTTAEPTCDIAGPAAARLYNKWQLEIFNRSSAYPLSAMIAPPKFPAVALGHGIWTVETHHSRRGENVLSSTGTINPKLANVVLPTRCDDRKMGP